VTILLEPSGIVWKHPRDGTARMQVQTAAESFLAQPPARNPFRHNALQLSPPPGRELCFRAIAGNSLNNKHRFRHPFPEATRCR
jgi:hypothetical protein